MRKSNRFLNILLIMLCIVLVAALGGLVVWNKKQTSKETQRLEEMADEAKQADEKALKELEKKKKKQQKNYGRKQKRKTKRKKRKKRLPHPLRLRPRGRRGKRKELHVGETIFSQKETQRSIPIWLFCSVFFRKMDTRFLLQIRPFREAAHCP